MESVEQLIEDIAHAIVKSDTKLVKFLNEISSHDKKLIFSLNQQIYHRSMPLTSRQYDLIVKVLTKYKSYFMYQGIDFDKSVNNAAFGFRVLDRGRYIRLEDDRILVQFSFSAKLLKIFNPLKSISGHDYSKKIHSFPATHVNVAKIIGTLIDHNFVIDEQLMEVYDECKPILDNPADFLPSVSSQGIKNLHANSEKHLIADIGSPPTLDNMFMYQDRSILHQIIVNEDEVAQSLAGKSDLTKLISQRKTASVNVLPAEFTFEDVFATLTELNRFPLMIVLNDFHENEQLRATHAALSKFVDNGEISVLHRSKNTGLGIEYNEYIKSRGLNNPLDKSIKVIYTTKSKLQKSILKAGIEVGTVLLASSVRLNNKLEYYISSADLILHFDKTVTSWRGADSKVQLLRRSDANMPTNDI